MRWLPGSAHPVAARLVVTGNCPVTQDQASTEVRVASPADGFPIGNRELDERHYPDMGIIGWIIIGGLAGWVASKIMNTDAQQGIILNIVVGIIGGLLGGWLLSLVNIDGNSGLIVSFLTALLGACLLLFVVKAVTKRA